MRSVLSFLLFISMSGCYTYAPASSASLAQGAAVRARLNAPGDFPLTDLTANRVMTVDGEVVRQDADALVLSATWLRSQSGYDFAAAGETVTIPAGTIAAVERRKVSLLRSAGVAMAGLLASALLVRVLEGGGSGASGGGGTTNPQ